MPDWKAFLERRLDLSALPPEDTQAILEELAQHLAERYEDAVAAGASHDEAFAAAAAQVPDASALAAAVARPRRLPAAPEPSGTAGSRVKRALVSCLQEARYAARMLPRTPTVTIVGIVTLALGIGGTTAMFSVVNAVLLRPLPFADPDRLVVVGQASDTGPSTAGYATFLDWRERSRSFDRMAAVSGWNPTLVAGAAPERLHGMRVTHAFFEALGAEPALGRLFTPEEDRPGASRRVALLSDGLWRRRFNADPAVVGRIVQISGVDYRMIGVLPPAFEPLISGHFYQPAEIWSPLGYDVSLPYACRSCQHLRVVGRLRADVTPDAAGAELDAIQRSLRAEHPADYVDRAMSVVRLRDEMVRAIRPTLRILMGAVALVLAIAVVNVASLMLARAAARRREMALRAALGAERRRIVAQLLSETVLLAAAGGAAGVVAALWATPVLVSLVPADLPRAADARIDGVALGFAAAVTLGCGLFAGLVPALRLSRANLANEVKAGAPGIRGGPRRARAALVATEVALAVVLLAGAGLMLRTMSTLLRVEPGFERRGVLTMQLSVTGSGFDDDARVIAFQRILLERIRALPAVESAALASQIPFGGNYDTYGLDIEARPELSPGERPAPQRYSVTPEYFDVLRIPLRQGRLLEEADRRGSDPVILS